MESIDHILYTAVQYTTIYYYSNHIADNANHCTTANMITVMANSNYRECGLWKPHRNFKDDNRDDL